MQDLETTHAVSVERPTDEKGRTDPNHMSERELLVEMVTLLRMGEDAALDMKESLNNNPMLKSMGFGI